MLRYYRFTSPEAQAAGREYSAQQKLLTEQARAVAEHFGGKALYMRSVHGRTFAGLRFEPPLDSPLWTKPDKVRCGPQRPRMSARGHRADLEDLRAQWMALMPTAEPRTDAMFKACGTDWGALLFSPLAYVIRDDAIYLATSLDLTARGQEITGGEYNAAVKATDATPEEALA